MSGELLPCPFCGKNPILVNDFPMEDLYTLSCENTACKIHPYKVGKTKEECIVDWNCRITEPEQKGGDDGEG